MKWNSWLVWVRWLNSRWLISLISILGIIMPWYINVREKIRMKRRLRNLRSHRLWWTVIVQVPSWKRFRLRRSLRSNLYSWTLKKIWVSWRQSLVFRYYTSRILRTICSRCCMYSIWVITMIKPWALLSNTWNIWGHRRSHYRKSIWSFINWLVRSVFIRVLTVRMWHWMVWQKICRRQWLCLKNYWLMHRSTRKHTRIWLRICWRNG